MSFAELRKRSQDLDAVREEIAPDENENGSERFLQIGIDKVGVAWCKVRFMPAPDGEKSSMITQERFKFENDSKTKEYAHLSLRNVPDPENASKRLVDPVQPYLDALWKAGEKDIYRERKKKVATYVNVYVIEDKVKPENNGKVLLWRLPYDVKTMLEKAVKPEEDKYDASKTPKPFNPFDIFGEAGGRDFVIRIKDKDGNNNYADSHFVDAAHPFLDGDEEAMETAWKECHSLFHFIDPSRHKDREDLLASLIAVIGPNDKFLSAVYPDECEEFKTKGKGSSKSSNKKEEKEASDKPSDKEETKEEKKKDEPKRESKVSKSSSDDLDIDF